LLSISDKNNYRRVYFHTISLLAKPARSAERFCFLIVQAAFTSFHKKRLTPGITRPLLPLMMRAALMRVGCMPLLDAVTE
jgi:hypothetical protein